jgi:hypothetical protein
MFNLAVHTSGVIDRAAASRVPAQSPAASSARAGRGADSAE